MRQSRRKRAKRHDSDNHFYFCKNTYNKLEEKTKLNTAALNCKDIDEITKLKEQLQALNSGMKPEEIMKKHGVIPGSNTVIEQEVFVEDKEKMAEFEQKLQMEKE